MSKLSKKSNFTIVNNGLISDSNISMKAKGIYMYLSSKPDGWDFYIKEISSNCTDGVDAIRSGLKELGELGYISRTKVNGSDGKFHYDYEIFEIPEGKVPRMDQPRMDIPTVVKSNTSNTNLFSNTDLNNTNNNKGYSLRIFEYYKTFNNLKKHRTLTGEMKTAIDKFKKQTSATEEDFKKVIRRHSKIVESTKGNDFPVRARSIQELFGQKAYQASHLVGSEYLDDGKYGSDYVVGKGNNNNSTVKPKEQAHIPKNVTPTHDISSDEFTSFMERLK